MPNKLNYDHPVGPPVNKIYFVSADHRVKKNSNKSRWLITVPDEIACFTQSHTEDWLDGDRLSWGLKNNGNSLLDIGVNSLDERLQLAKFVGGAANRWHGYPADYRRNTQDRPSMNILLKWKEQELIQKHHITRIRRGFACNL